MVTQTEQDIERICLESIELRLTAEIFREHHLIQHNMLIQPWWGATSSKEVKTNASLNTKSPTTSV
jgi:hypothetical protein